MKNETSLRDQLVKLLDFEEAHVGFDRAVTGIPARLRGTRPRGAEHSLWQLVEHLRIAQADILEFCRKAKYKEDHHMSQRACAGWHGRGWRRESLAKPSGWRVAGLRSTRSRSRSKSSAPDIPNLPMRWGFGGRF